jgi:hypothetical protein
MSSNFNENALNLQLKSTKNVELSVKYKNFTNNLNHDKISIFREIITDFKNQAEQCTQRWIFDKITYVKSSLHIT